MTKKIFNLITEFKAGDETDKGLFIEGMASTKDTDRVGDIIEPTAWGKGGLTNYKKNPIVLFNHNHDKPIGKATDVKVTENGLKMKAFISKHAPDGVLGLIKDGVLGAFSVGFMIKDADYNEETGGLTIKAAELFENSVVSVPMNQSATFSLAKSFDSDEEYEEYKKTFTNRVDLAGQSLASKETIVSDIASDTLEGEEDTSHKEIKMDRKESTSPDLAELAKKAAKETAAEIAMQKAKEKAQLEAEAAEKARKAAEKEEVANTVKAGVDGVEKLVNDLEAKFLERDANFDEIIKSLKSELEDKTNEIANMQNSKRIFVDRTTSMSVKEALEANKEAVVQAHLLGKITGKGWNTDFGKSVLQKGGLDYDTDTAATGELDIEIQDLIQKEIWLETKVASLFREIEVNGRATVLPLQSDTGYAQWGINQGFDPAAHGNLENRSNVATGEYKARSVTMLVDRMISSTYIDNDVEEKTLVNLLPMLFQGVARAHARAVEVAIMLPNNVAPRPNVIANVDDFLTNAVASGVTTAAPNGGTKPFTANMLTSARGAMGRYGLTPSDVAYIVSMEVYYDLIADPEFQNLNEVGDIATKLRGVVGGVFGSPVIVSEEFLGEGDDVIGAIAVNRNNYVIPRLRGVSVESDYEVANQRTMIVASQSLGFTELFDGDGAGNEPVVSIAYGAAA